MHPEHPPMFSSNPSSSSFYSISNTVSNDVDTPVHHQRQESFVTPSPHLASFSLKSQQEQQCLQHQQKADYWTPQVLLRPLLHHASALSLEHSNSYNHNPRFDHTTMTAQTHVARAPQEEEPPGIPVMNRASRSLTHDLTIEQAQNGATTIKTSTHKVLMDFVDWWCFKILRAKGNVYSTSTASSGAASDKNANDSADDMLWQTLVEHEEELHKALENLDDNPLQDCNNNNKQYGRLWNRMSLVALSLDVGVVVVGKKPTTVETTTHHKDLLYSLDLPEPYDHWQLWQEELIMLKSMLLRKDANVDIQQQPQAEDALPDPTKEQHALFTTEYADVCRLLQVQHSLTQFYTRLLHLLDVANNKANDKEFDEELFQNQIKSCVDDYEQDIHKLYGAIGQEQQKKKDEQKEKDSDDSDDEQDEDKSTASHTVGSDVRQLPQPLVGFLLKELYNAQPSRKRLQGPSVLPQRLVHRVEHVMLGSSEYGHAACLKRVRTLLRQWHDHVLEEPTLVRLGYGGTVVEDEDDRKRVQAAEAKEDALLRRLSSCGGPEEGTLSTTAAAAAAAASGAVLHSQESVSDWEDSEDEDEQQQHGDTEPLALNDDPQDANQEMLREQQQPQDPLARKRKAITIEWSDSEDEEQVPRKKQAVVPPPTRPAVIDQRPGRTLSLAARFANFRQSTSTAKTAPPAKKTPTPSRPDPPDELDVDSPPEAKRPYQQPQQPQARRIPFTRDEVQAIVDGVRRHGAGNWALIKEDANGRLDRRNTVQIKDKYRNMVKNGEFY